MKKLFFLGCLPVLLWRCSSATTDEPNNNQGNSATSVSNIVSDSSHHQESDVVKMTRSFLQKEYRDDLSKNIIDSNSRRFMVGKYDLDGDNRPEVFVKLTGMYFCGSGGCTILLLNHDGQLITCFTVSETPVTIANTQTHDWYDLGITSKGKMHTMKYDGTKYPSNPSVQPLTKNAEEYKAKVLDVQQSQEKWSTF